jgi:hypothetical protein
MMLSPFLFPDAKDRPYGVVEGVITARIGARYLHDWSWRPNLEVRAGAIFTVQWFESLRPPPDRPARDAVTDTVWLIHVPVSLNVVHVASAPIHLGIGPGIDVSFPVFEHDNGLAYTQLRPFLDVFAGWWLTRAIAVEIGTRLIPQRLYRYNVDYRSQPTATSDEALLWMWEGRMRFGQ